MKTFKQFVSEEPTNHVGNGGYTRSADASGPVAGDDKKLFRGPEDLLSQDFQTPAESGEDRYARFSNIYPVMRVSLSNNDGDGPSIDAMVAASKEFVTKMDDASYARVRKNFRQFRESWTNKYKKSIDCSNPKGFSQKAHCAGRKKRAAGEQTTSKPVE